MQDIIILLTLSPFGTGLVVLERASHCKRENLWRRSLRFADCLQDNMSLEEQNLFSPEAFLACYSLPILRKRRDL